MTNEKKLMQAIGNIDDKFILEATQEKSIKKNKGYLKWVALAACLCLCVGGVALALTLGRDKPKTDDVPWQTKYVNVGYEQSTGDNAYIKRWDERTIDEQYLEAKLLDSTYSSACHSIEKSELGQILSTAELTGYDEYEEKSYALTAPTYEIKGISPECAVAVELKDNSFYVYRNSNYVPESVGDFIEDLSLYDNIVIGGASFTWYDEKNDKYETVVFEESIDKDKVFEMLLSDKDVKPIENFHEFGFDGEISLSISIPKLGYNNIALGVNSKGCVVTNILDTGKAFYIGEDKTKTFSDYVKDNYEGFIIVYESPNDNVDYSNDSSSSVASTVVTTSKPQNP